MYVHDPTACINKTFQVNSKRMYSYTHLCFSYKANVGEVNIRFLCDFYQRP